MQVRVYPGGQHVWIVGEVVGVVDQNVLIDRDRIEQPAFEASKGEEVYQRIHTRRGHVRIFCQIAGAVEIGELVRAAALRRAE